MPDAGWVRQQADVSLGRLWPRLGACVQAQRLAQPEEWRAFETRLRHEWERLFGFLIELYGEHYDFFYHLEEILTAAARSWLARPGWLKQLDTRREVAPDWFQSQQMVGGVCYIDRYAACCFSQARAAPTSLVICAISAAMPSNFCSPRSRWRKSSRSVSP